MTKIPENQSDEKPKVTIKKNNRPSPLVPKGTAPGYYIVDPDQGLPDVQAEPELNHTPVPALIDTPVNTHVNTPVEPSPPEEKVITEVNQYILANRKPLFEDTHRKYTCWFENDLFDRFNNLTKGNPGLKTKIINEALETFMKKIKA